MGGFPPGGCSGSFKVGADEEGTDGDAVPLGFLVDASCICGLLVEGTEKVCVGHEELPEALVLGGGIGAGCFPFDTGGVAV